MAKAEIIPVIMSGGVGARLWPASRQAKPKQLLAFTNDKTMIQNTALRLGRGGSGFQTLAPMIVCSTNHAHDISSQLNALGISPGLIITEPVGRNTAPCAAIAALEITRTHPNALMLLAAADHHIQDESAFTQVITRALPATLAGHIVTFAITATYPETGYGYIQKGKALDAHAFRVAAFKEKPCFDTARAYIKSGAYFWNAGLFMCKPKVLLDEMARHCPDILQACATSLAQSPNENGTIHLDAASFKLCPADSIDYALMERTDKAALVEADMGWSDIGSWSALLDLTKSEDGNAIKGDVHMIDTKHALVHTDGPFVATIGVDNLAIIVHDGAVLVAHMDRVQEVKQIIDMLKHRGDKKLL